MDPVLTAVCNPVEALLFGEELSAGLMLAEWLQNLNLDCDRKSYLRASRRKKFCAYEAIAIRTIASVGPKE